MISKESPPVSTTPTRSAVTPAQASMPQAYQTNFGTLVPYARMQPPAGVHPHQEALRTQLPPLASDAIPANVFPAALVVHATASAHTPPEASSTGLLQGAPVPTATPFVLEVPQTHTEIHTAVRRASDAFWLRYVGLKWVSAREVLQTFGEKMALMPDSQEAGESSTHEEAALKKLKGLPLIRAAFCMGACHYYGAAKYGGTWCCRLRFQKPKASVTIHDVVEHYMVGFGDPESRAQTFMAVMVHVSWLAPDWIQTGRPFWQTQDERLDSGLKKLSNALMMVYNGIWFEDDRKAFLKDLLSAVRPAYCSPLLTPWLRDLPAFQECGNGLETNLAYIERWNGLQLFPLVPNYRKGDAGEMIFLKEPPAPYAPKQTTAMKRPRESGIDDGVEVQQRQPRPRLGSAIVPPPESAAASTFVLTTPLTVKEVVSAVENATDAFGSLYEGKQWVGARGVLRTFTPNFPDQTPELAPTSDLAVYSNNNNNSNSSSSNAAFEYTYTLPPQEALWPPALEQETVLVEPAPTPMLMSAQTRPAALASQFRIPSQRPSALALPLPTPPPEALGLQTLKQLTQQQRMQEIQPFPPRAQESASGPVSTHPSASGTPMPPDPALPTDVFDLFNWY